MGHEPDFKIHHPDFEELNKRLERRDFLKKTAGGLGALALGTLLSGSISSKTFEQQILEALPTLAPKAKRVLYLFMSGGPSQFETFDYKPMLSSMLGKGLPESVRNGQRLTGMSANQSKLPIAPSFCDFKQYGKSKTWVIDLLPYTAEVVDELCIIKSMYTEQINHDPALTFFQTGSQVGNRPSMGSWISYGLGSENKNLPAFCVLLSKGKGNGQGVYSKLWNNGFLDSIHQGVQFSSGEEPVKYLTDPEFIKRGDKREILDEISALNQESYKEIGDPEIVTKIQQYELSYRMQMAVPEITSLQNEPESIVKMYGPECLVPGTYAANCLLARNLSENGVRFVQLYHQGWDTHGNLPKEIEGQCKDIDQSSAALILFNLLAEKARASVVTDDVDIPAGQQPGPGAL
jgi:hypothetical protein